MIRLLEYFFGVDVAAADCHVPLYILNLFLPLEKGVQQEESYPTNITATFFLFWHETKRLLLEKERRMVMMRILLCRPRQVKLMDWVYGHKEENEVITFHTKRVE